jgi:hypothetical protein
VSEVEKTQTPASPAAILRETPSLHDLAREIDAVNLVSRSAASAERRDPLQAKSKETPMSEIFKLTDLNSEILMDEDCAEDT